MTTNISDSEQALARCGLLIEEGVRNALSASLYESPGDILFMHTALVIELANGRLADAVVRGPVPLAFGAGLYGPGGRLASWGAVPAAVDTAYHIADAVDVELGAGEHFEARVYVNPQTEVEAKHFLPGVAMEIGKAWKTLADRLGRNVCQDVSACCESAGPETSMLSQSVQRTVTSRFREALQRLEEELPQRLRVTLDDRGDPVPSQLYLLRKCARGRLAYIMTHEDLRLLRHWTEQGIPSLVERFQSAARSLGCEQDSSPGHGYHAIDRLLDDIRNHSQETVLPFLRTVYERPLHMQADPASVMHLPPYRVLESGAPAIAWNQQHDALHYSGRRTPGDIQTALIEQAFWEAQPRYPMDGDWRNILFWPLGLMGRPLLVAHFSFTGGNPLFSNEEEVFNEFVELVRALTRLGQSAWNILFDLYCELFAEGFAERYLDHLRTRHEKRTGSGHECTLDELVMQLNAYGGMLSRLFNIDVARWSDGRGCNAGSHLWSLQDALEVVEEGRSRTHIGEEEEKRLMKIVDERPHLERLFICPPTDADAGRTGHAFMYQHLAWRLGHYVRYSLPALLMSLHYHTEYAMRRQREILCHELGGLIGGSRKAVLRLDENPGEARDDLRLLLRLTQRTLDLTDMDGSRRTDIFSTGPIEPLRLFKAIRRNFRGRLQLTTEAGYEGHCEIIPLHGDGVRVWISEEDLYAVWRNLWSNARWVLDDHSRETPGDGERRAKRAEILERCGPFSRRFPEAPPQPTLLAILYCSNTDDGKRWHMDILDNAPQIRGGPLIYPDRVRVCHYGLRVVDEIAHRLTEKGHRAEFTPIHVLSREQAAFYEEFPRLQCYNWRAFGYWTRTSFSLTMEEK